MISTGESIIKHIQDYQLEGCELHSAYITDEGNIRLLFDIPRNYGFSSCYQSQEDKEQILHTGTLKWIELVPIRRS